MFVMSILSRECINMVSEEFPKSFCDVIRGNLTCVQFVERSAM